MPRVSVIMSVFNREKTVARAIDSILAQTFQDFEFIICDDGSSDNSLQILKEYAQKDLRIVVIQNEKNLGLPASLNRSILLAQSEYVARMDDDDISYPTRLQKQVDFLDSHLEYALVGTGRRTFDEEGVWGIFDGSVERSKKDIFKGKCFTHPTVMIRRSVLLEVGCYTVSSWTLKGQDYDLWCKIYEQGYKGYVLGEILLDYYEKRDFVRNNSLKKRLGSFLVAMKHRRKLRLPFYYDYYAVLRLLRYFVPSFVIRRHMLKSRKGSL